MKYLFAFLSFLFLFSLAEIIKREVMAIIIFITIFVLFVTIGLNISKNKELKKEEPFEDFT